MVPPPPPPPPPAPPAEFAPERSQYESRKAIEKTMQAVMNTENILPQLAQPAKKTVPGSGGIPMRLATNHYKINMTKELNVFRYNVNIEAEINGKAVVFTKRSKSDAIVLARKKKCCAIMKKICDLDFLSSVKLDGLYYDGQNILFTLERLFPEGQAIKLKDIKIAGADVGLEELLECETISVQIFVADDQVRGNNERVHVSKEELDRLELNVNLDERDSSLRQFLEISMKQFTVWDEENFANLGMGTVFLKFPLNHGFTKEDITDVGEGKSLYPALKKGVAMLEGDRNVPAVYASFDHCKAPFHKKQPLIEKLVEACNWDKIKPLHPGQYATFSNIIRDLSCFTIHTGKKLLYVIDSITTETPKDKMIETSDGTISIMEYFFKRYHKNLLYPTVPLVKMKNKNGTLFPMELLTVEGFQRVTTSQMTPPQMMKTTRACALTPYNRLGGTEKIMNSTDICNNNYLEQIGLNIEKRPLEVPARILPAPQLKFKNDIVQPHDGRFQIKGQAPIVATVPMWAAYCIKGDRYFGQKELDAFGSEFLRVCRQRGIKIDNPQQVGMLSINEIEERIAYAAKHGCKFFLFLTPDSITSVHSLLKLCEVKYTVITQDLKCNTANTVVRQKKWLTLDNIVNKLNIKLGGQNYVVEQPMVENSLILGISMSHPSPSASFDLQTSATVVGYAANTNVMDGFSGNFTYIPARRTEVMLDINYIVNDVLSRYRELHKNPPNRLIIYRSGASQGDYPMILKQEIPIIVGVLQKQEKPIRLIFIAVTKEHNTRLYATNVDKFAKPTQQNITTGVVVDTGVVHPTFKEFYLNSHLTLQGSAKTPRYTVLFDDTSSKMERLEKFTYDMCYNHQIVGLPTSLPSPLYIAEEYAKRGRSLLGEYLSSNPQVDAGNLAGLNSCLSLTNSELRNLRYNA